jgi:hypothetical protein
LFAPNPPVYPQRLADPDAKDLLDKGWGELHLLAGTERVPLGVVMVGVIAEVLMQVAVSQRGMQLR